MLGYRRRRLSAALTALFTLLFAAPALAALPPLDFLAGMAMPGAPTPGPALSSNIGSSASLAVDSDGNVYSADPAYHVIERVDPNGLLSVYAGTGAAGTPVAGSALASPLNGPHSLAMAANDDLYVGDGSRVLRIDHATGMLSIFASGFTKAEAMAFDADGDLYVLDSGAHTIVKVDAAGTKTPVVGSGASTLPVNGPAAGASIGDGLRGIAVDADGDIYWTPSLNNVVAKLDVSADTISIVAGTGLAGFITPGMATSSDLYWPGGLAISANGDLYVGQMRGDCDLVKIDGAGMLSFVNGQYGGCTVPWQNTPFDQLPLVETWGLTFDSTGSLYLATLWAYILKAPGVAAPAAPASVVTTPGNGKVTLSFKEPKTNGSSPLTGYQVSSDGGNTWVSLSTSAAGNGRRGGEVSGLTNGVTYDVRVRAVGSPSGPGPDTARSVTPAAVAPGAPTGLSTQARDASAELTFSAPSDNGGATISGYEASTDGVNWTALTTTTNPNSTYTATLANLTNGTTYNVRVRAVNSAGGGAASGTSSVKPFTTPDAPTALTTLPGDRSATLRFSRPNGDGGSTITGYEVSTDDGAHWATMITTAGPNGTRDATVSGLTNGTAYAIKVRAVNAAGASAATAAASTALPVLAPGAPTSVSASPRNGAAELTFTPPVHDGGATISRYEVSTNGGSTWTTVTTTAAGGGTRTARVTGLTNQVAVTIQVRAVNSAGAGADASAAPVTPVPSAPDAPTALAAAAGDGVATLSFTPADDGGSPVLRYEVSLDNGGWVTLANDRRIGSLVNRQTYSVRVRAVNGVGASAASGAVTVTPYVVTTPAVPSATASTSSITATWSVPNPSTDITGYTAYAFPGPSQCETHSVNDTSCVLGAVAGTSYTVTVVAHGANGADSPASPASAPVTPALPETPAQVPANTPLTLTTDKGQIALAEPDQEITVIGTGFAKHSTATVTVFSTPRALGTVVTDGNGNFSVPVRVPADLHAGGHTFFAAGVNPAGQPRTMALPVTVPPKRVDSSAGGDGNRTQLPVPAGGSITLLDGAGGATSTVVIPGQGTYVLDPATGTIAFIPVKGFSGRASAVSYRLTDAVGSSVTGSYTAFVTAAPAPEDTGAGAPVPPGVGAGAGKPGVKAGRSVAGGARTPITCTLDGGAALERCAVKLYAKLSGRAVLVGAGEAAGARVSVKLTAAGRGLVTRVGGVRLTARATITQRGRAGALTASRTLTVVASEVRLDRLVRFASGSAAVTAADRAYLVGVRKQLAGARTVTCVGHTDDLGTGNAALGRRRAAAVCAVLTRGSSIRARLVTRADRVPRATNSTVAGRSANRRATVTIGY